MQFNTFHNYKIAYKMLNDWNRATETIIQALDEGNVDYAKAILAEMNEQYWRIFNENIKID